MKIAIFAKNGRNPCFNTLHTPAKVQRLPNRLYTNCIVNQGNAVNGERYIIHHQQQAKGIVLLFEAYTLLHFRQNQCNIDNVAATNDHAHLQTSSLKKNRLYTPKITQ